MRKVVKGLKLMLIMVLMISLTGCVKLNTTMQITKEDVKISSIIALQDSLYEMGGNTESNQEEVEEYKKAGYTVEEYKQDGYTGYKLTKSLGTLDSLSKDGKETEVDLTELITGEKAKLENLFYVDGGVYHAKFLMDTDGLTNDLENEMNTDNSTEEENSSDFTEDENSSDFSSEDDFSGLTGDDFDADQLMSSFDLKFEVTLPSEAISHNATKVSDDKKTLTWDLTKEDNIEFSFKANNSMATYIIIGCIAGIVVAAAIIIVIINKNKKKKHNTMYTQPMNGMNQQNMPTNNMQQPIQNQMPNSNTSGQNNINN